MTRLPIWKRAALVPFLLFGLWLLTDNDTSGSYRKHHLAVFTALRRHPPCLRVYRSLLEINLLLWGVAVSLWIWKNTVGSKMIGHLLFQPASATYAKSAWDAGSTKYVAVELEDRTPLTATDILMLGKRVEPNLEQDSPIERVDTNPDGTQMQSQPQPEQQQQQQSDDIITEEMGWDAQYDSDGEIEEQSKIASAFEPPKVEAVLAVAVDSLVLILVSLFLFTLSSAEGGLYVDGLDDVGAFRFMASIAAPLFPLLLFLATCVAVVTPWKGGRGEFWQIISFTMGAPMYHVTFRDGFIGDILTSSVRPMQDIAFTVFYIISGLQGWWKQSYDLDDADLPLESNWILHTCILPMCMASPLWWRFLQNLRQCYENKKRWPYLGNALKYFIAAEVAMFGVFDPTKKQSFLWLSCFVFATLYQIWWDVFMDWELLKFETGKGLRLRSTRIYSVSWIYWTIFGINIVLRFCWTLSFLPQHYLDRTGTLSRQFEGDLSHILNPTIASAEIIRRTLWGLLRVEMEAIKVARVEPRLKGAWSDPDFTNSNNQDDDSALQTMTVEEKETRITELAPPSRLDWINRDMYMQNDFQIISELCIYATVFTALGLLAAAHRVTL